MKVVLLLFGIASAVGIIKAIIAVFVPFLFAFGYVIGLHDTPLTLIDCRQAVYNPLLAPFTRPPFTCVQFLVWKKSAWTLSQLDGQ